MAKKRTDPFHVCNGGMGCGHVSCACPCHYGKDPEPRPLGRECDECGEETEDGLCRNKACGRNAPEDWREDR